MLSPMEHINADDWEEVAHGTANTKASSQIAELISYVPTDAKFLDTAIILGRLSSFGNIHYPMTNSSGYRAYVGVTYNGSWSGGLKVRILHISSTAHCYDGVLENNGSTSYSENTTNFSSSLTLIRRKK